VVFDRKADSVEPSVAKLTLLELAPGVTVTADLDGVKVSGRPTADSAIMSKTRLGRLLDATATQLLEGGYATEVGNNLVIPFGQFVALDQHEIDAFDDLAPPSPFTLTLESIGSLGLANFAYRYRFYLGDRLVYPERLGCFLQYDGRIFRLDASTFALLEAIDRFNAEPPERKLGASAFIRFAEVKGLASIVGAQLDRFITREKVLIASRIGLDLVLEPDGRISFAPKIAGAPVEALRKAFFTSDDAEEMYRLDDPEGGRIRVVLDDQQREVLRRMQRVRHLGGAERAMVLRNPSAVFDGVANEIDLELEQFGPRVKGIGDFPVAVQPYVRLTGEKIFEARSDFSDAVSQSGMEAGLECRYADGSTATVAFANGDEARAFRAKARQAWRDGSGLIEYKGKSIAVDEALIRACDEQVDALQGTAPQNSANAAHKRKYLLIHTNERAVDYLEHQASREGSALDCELPNALRSDRSLKQHQKEGLAWLQRCFKLGRRGCLLADDMGLGKTLQVLTFLAWLIESGEISAGSSDVNVPPWDPILIVTPLVLLENQIWQRDMQKFFRNQGSVFQPWLALHGPELKRLQTLQRAASSETLEGLSLLDIETMRRHRVILTNYETVTNHQFSFARKDIGWSVVVTDEAQAYKTPNTKISHALKGMSPRFRIGCTGTPVETRLRDVWNIFDFLQPGQLLASESEFVREIEKPYEESSKASDRDLVLADLRSKLQIGEPDAWIMRRDKLHRLPGLPEKIEHKLRAPLSDEQRRMHLEVIKAATSRKAHPFELLGELMDIYQHPALRPRFEGISTEEALARCPKLQAVMERLEKIRERGEKALIFAHRKPMQQLLASTIGDRFGLRVNIINGDSATDKNKGAPSTRRQMLADFQARVGFDVLVLSPVVAGLGLTLVEANHVFHYGRWWNPALEAQATDRVYRIGQTRPVHVYYPIAYDPQGDFTSFDEKLDRIIQRRRKMAADFLTPLPSSEQIQQELFEDVIS
jgi:hypothetical protein